MRRGRFHLWVALVLAALGNLGCLYTVRSTANPPRWYFYVLALVSFLVWALATNAPVQGLIGVKPDIASFILLAGVFLIPLADKLLSDDT